MAELPISTPCRHKDRKGAIEQEQPKSMLMPRYDGTIGGDRPDFVTHRKITWVREKRHGALPRQELASQFGLPIDIGAIKCAPWDGPENPLVIRRASSGRLKSMTGLGTRGCPVSW